MSVSSVERLIRYWRRIRGEVEMRSELLHKNSSSSFEEEVFIERMADLLEEKGEISGYQLARWKYKPSASSPVLMKIDAFSLEDHADQAPPTEAMMLVSDWKNTNDFDFLSNEGLDTLIQAGQQFLHQVISNADFARSLEPSRAHYDFVHTFQKHSKTIQRVHMLFLTNRCIEKRESQLIQIGHVQIYMRFWDLSALEQLEHSQSSSGGQIHIDLRTFGGALPCLSAPEDHRYQAYLAVLPATTLKNIYDAYGTRLLEANVRSFLQVKNNKVNQGIRNTILKDSASFFAFNNGLSATAEDVRVERIDGQQCLTYIKGLQIVNGAQTTGSLHRASVQDHASLEQISVPLKLTCIRPEYSQSLTPLISKYANSQSKVELADFSANHTFFIELERLSRSIHLPPQYREFCFFERARGQYENELARCTDLERVKHFKVQYPKDKVFSKTDVAKFIYSWDGFPYLVSRGAQKNFSHFVVHWIRDYEQSKQSIHAKWYQRFIAQSILYNTVYECAARIQLRSYRSSVVTYVVALLSYHSDAEIDLDLIWKQQKLSSAFSELATEWCLWVHQTLKDTAEDITVSDWAKKEACWKLFLEREPISPLEDIPEIRSEDADRIPQSIPSIPEPSFQFNERPQVFRARPESVSQPTIQPETQPVAKDLVLQSEPGTTQDLNFTQTPTTPMENRTATQSKHPESEVPVKVQHTEAQHMDWKDVQASAPAVRESKDAQGSSKEKMLPLASQNIEPELPQAVSVDFPPDDGSSIDDWMEQEQAETRLQHAQPLVQIEQPAPSVKEPKSVLSELTTHEETQSEASVSGVQAEHVVPHGSRQHFKEHPSTLIESPSSHEPTVASNPSVHSTPEEVRPEVLVARALLLSASLEEDVLLRRIAHSLLGKKRLGKHVRKRAMEIVKRLVNESIIAWDPEDETYFLCSSV